MKRFLKYTLITLLALPLLAAAFLWGLYLTADTGTPTTEEESNVVEKGLFSGISRRCRC